MSIFNFFRFLNFAKIWNKNEKLTWPSRDAESKFQKKTLYCNFKQVLCFSMQYEPKLYLLNCWKRYPLTEPPKQTISKNLLFVFSRFCRPKEKFREKSADALCVRLLWSRDGHRAKLSARKKIEGVRSDRIFSDPITLFAARFFSNPMSKFWNVLSIRSHFSSDLIGYVIRSDDFTH